MHILNQVTIVKNQINTHTINGIPNNLEITIKETHGYDNANYGYTITNIAKQNINSKKQNECFKTDYTIYFQNGKQEEVGINGISELALLSIINDRLHSLEKGNSACGELHVALVYVEEAISWLKRRELINHANQTNNIKTNECI